MTTKTYTGNPCKKGGHTLRYVKGGHCVVCSNTYYKKKYAECSEKYKAYKKKWRDGNTEKLRAYNKKWQKENPGLCNHYTALRKATIKEQTPPWADLEKIKEIYLTCPDGYEVDHIHPLSRGGLHVDYNLQYLTIYENRSKGANILY